MNPVLTEQTSLIDWGVASRPMIGETVCGDLHLVKPFPGGVLIGAVDGLGHGEEATAAARAAVEFLERNAGQPITSLVRCCHEAITKTRGAVMTLACLQSLDNTMTWLGVGNVQGRLWRAQSCKGPPSESVLLRSGLVGHQIPQLYALVVPIHAGDCIIFATDGVAPEFDEGLNLGCSPQQIADQILQRHFKGTDDALVLVARRRGGNA